MKKYKSLNSKELVGGGGSATHVAHCKNIHPYFIYWCEVLPLISGWLLKMSRGIDAKIHGLLRNILISPLEGEKKFLSELCELRNFREGDNLKNSCSVQYETVLEPSPAFVMLTKVRKRLLPLTKREGINSVIINNLTDSNHSQFITYHSLKRKVAFTLAEVLITLGIIGIVATMTLPVLIEQHEKKVTAVKLEKFYTIMSQAVLRWRTEEDITDDFLFPDEIVRNDEKSKIWYTNNLQPYINSGIYDKKYYENRYFSVRFNDGSGFVAYVSSPDVMYIFYCTKFKYCAQEHYDGRRTFLFSLYHGNFYTSHPEQSSLDRDFFLEKCKNPSDGNSIHRHYCTRLIQYDGWEIKPDYPWKIN